MGRQRGLVMGRGQSGKKQRGETEPERQREEEEEGGWRLVLRRLDFRWSR